MTEPLIERDCTIEHQGQTFSAAGAILAPCADGRWRGVVYESATSQDVCTWHGKRIARATWGRPYQGNYCRMQSVRFDWQGMTFIGRYCPDSSQAIKVRTTKIH